MGHTAEEKIKILYEDSLNDIRGLTDRMESLTAAVVAAAETVNAGKATLSRQNEQFLIDVKTIKEAVGQIAVKNGAGKEEVKRTVEEVLLGETGPMKEMRDISKRFFSTEAAATKWLVKATEKMDQWDGQYIWHLAGTALVGGIVGGIVVRIFL